MMPTEAIDEQIDELFQQYNALTSTGTVKKEGTAVDTDTGIRVYGIVSSLISLYKIKDKIVPETERAEYSHKIEYLEAIEEQLRIRIEKVCAIARKATKRIDELGGMV